MNNLCLHSCLVLVFGFFWVFFTCIHHPSAAFFLVFFHSCTQRRDLPHQLVFSYPYCQAEWLAHCGNRLCEWQSNQSCLHHERRCIYDFSSLSVTPWFMPDHHAVSWIIIFFAAYHLLVSKKKRWGHSYFFPSWFFTHAHALRIYLFSQLAVY